MPFQNIVAIFKINSIDSSFFLFLYVGLLGLVIMLINFVCDYSDVFYKDFSKFDLGIDWV